MDLQYSTLELVRRDETARAPERDHDATAFELDVSALAPQTVLDTTPQVLYSSSLSEAFDNNDESTKERAISLHIIKPSLKWLWVIVTFVIAAAIAIGVGVGIWRQRKRQDHSITLAAQVILDDTSLAALSLPNGDRQLFFQDSTGLIRRAVRTASNSQWSTSPNLNASLNLGPHPIVNSNPKKYTPLAVTVPGGSADPALLQIELYYISENHTLNSSVLIFGSWSPGSAVGIYSTAVYTRSLSITSTGYGSSDIKSTTNSALLYYENPTGNVSALLQRFSPQDPQYSQYSQVEQAQWIDITSQKSKSLPDEFRNVPHSNHSNTLYETSPWGGFGTPFTGGAYFSNISIGAVIYQPHVSWGSDGPPESGGLIVFTNYTVGPSGPGGFEGGFLPNQGIVQNSSSIRRSDIATFGSIHAMWINDTQPVSWSLGDFEPDLPGNAFSFARLASVTLADQSATFLYHQINGTTFAEEQWDNLLGAWAPSEYITVSDS